MGSSLFIGTDAFIERFRAALSGDERACDFLLGLPRLTLKEIRSASASDREELRLRQSLESLLDEARRTGVPFSWTAFRALATSADISARKAFLVFACHLADPQCRNEAIQLLSDDHVGDMAATVLGQIADPESRKALASAIENGTLWRHQHLAAALSAMGAVGDPAYASIILPFVEHDAREVRRAAIAALVGLRDVRGLEVLLALIPGRRDRETHWAVELASRLTCEALAMIPTPIVVRLAALDDFDGLSEFPEYDAFPMHVEPWRADCAIIRGIARSELQRRNVEVHS